MVSYGINNGGTITGDVTVNGSSPTDQVFAVQVTGDPQPGCVIRADGRIELGGRVTAPDVTFFRDGSTRLHTTNTLLTEGDLQCDVVGRGLIVREGTNARMGTLTLNGATPVVVANTSVTASTRIFLTANAPGGTPGHFWVSARTAGTSFSVTGTAGDTSTVAYLLVEPAT